MLRLLHLADLHLGWEPVYLPDDKGKIRRLERDRLLEKAADYALSPQGNIQVVFIVGDLFEEYRPENVAELTQHRQKQLKQKDQELICVEPDGKPMNPVTLSSRMRCTAKALGLKASLHSLRHTHATILLKNGAPMLFVSARLGHSTTSFTSDVYGHRTLNDDYKIAAMFESALRAN